METRELIKIAKEHPENYAAAAEGLRELNQSYMQSLIQMLNQEDCENKDELLFESKRIRKAFDGVVKTPRDYFCYEFGVFNESFRMFQETLQAIYDNETERMLQGLLSGSHVKEIIQYLHENPYARQGTIAEKIGIKPNYLSEILNKLLANNLIERYGKHKSTQYCLTREGRKIFRTYFSIQQQVAVDVECWEEYEEYVEEKRGKLKELEAQREILKGKEDIKYGKRDNGFAAAVKESGEQLGKVCSRRKLGSSSKYSADAQSIA